MFLVLTIDCSGCEFISMWARNSGASRENFSWEDVLVNKVSFLFIASKPWTKFLQNEKTIHFPTIKVFPKDTSFFSLPHARHRPPRHATVAIWRKSKRVCSEDVVRATLCIYSAKETSFRRLKRKSFGIVVFLYRRLRSHPILNQASYSREIFLAGFWLQIRESVLFRLNLPHSNQHATRYRSSWILKLKARLILLRGTPANSWTQKHEKYVRFVVLKLRRIRSSVAQIKESTLWDELDMCILRSLLYIVSIGKCSCKPTYCEV